MEVTGKIKVINETETVGAAGFRKRDMVVTTEDQYPQDLSIQFVQDKVDLLDSYQPGQDVKVSINLRGREWINPEGKAIYFNTIQGWRIEAAAGTSNEAPTTTTPGTVGKDKEPDDLPF